MHLIQTRRINLTDLEWTKNRAAALDLPDNSSLGCKDVYTTQFDNLAFCLAGDLYVESLDPEKVGGAVGIQSAVVRARLIVRELASGRVMHDIINLESGDLFAKLKSKEKHISNG